MKFLKRLALTLALLGAAAPVEAVTRYCDDNGVASWNDAWNPSAPCSPSTATGNAAAGDTVLLQDGSYSNIFYDLGRSGTPNDPVVWEAADGALGDVVITGTNTVSAYDHANHTFRFLVFWWDTTGAADQTGLRLWGHGLKFKNCRFNQGIGLYATHSDSALFKDCTFRWSTECAGFGLGADRCSIISSTAYAKTSNDRACQSYGGMPYLMNITADHCFVQSVRCSVYSTPGSTTSDNRRCECGVLSYGGEYNLFYNNRFDYFNIGDPKCGIPMGLGWRNSTIFNRWAYDTLVYHGPSKGYMFAGPQSGDTTKMGDHSNTMYGCVFHADSVDRLAADSVSSREPFAFRWHDMPMVQDSIAYCTFITGNQNPSGAYNRGAGTWMNFSNLSSISRWVLIPLTNRRGHIVHNNFINYAITGFSATGDPGGAAFTWAVGVANAHDDSMVIRDNIFYTPNLNTDLRERATGNTHQSSTVNGLTNADSVDYNLLWKPKGDERPIWYDNYTKYAKGAGTSDSFYIDTGLQEHGIFAAPMFVDSTIVNASKDTFNISLATNSPARWAASDGTHIGAWQGYQQGERVPIISSPDGGEEWIAGSSHDITWDVTDPGGTGCTPVRTKLYYRIDDGNVWNLIVDDNGWEDPLYGSYSWSIPAITASTARIKVQLYKTGSVVCATDSSTGTFEIVDNVAPDVSNITLSNDEWRLCETNTIGWTASDDVGIDHFVITLEDFGTGHRDTLASDLDGTLRSYNWVMPYGGSAVWGPGQVARPRVYAYDGTGNSDSTVRTSLVATYDRQAPVVYVTAPASGTYPLDTTLTVTWIATDCVADDEYLTTALYYENYDKSSYKWKVADVDNGTPSVEVDLSQAPFLLPPLEVGDRIRFWISSSDDYTNEGWGVGPLMTLKAAEDVGVVPDKVRNLWADWVGWSAVRLRWTSVGDADSTELKYDTTPLTQSGAGDFRTHGTALRRAPAAEGVEDTCTITGLTPGTRYYFALRHIGNTGTPVETSLVSIPECRTTRPAVLKGLHATSTRKYPLIGVDGKVMWEVVVEDSFPHNIAGWPIFDNMSTSTPMRDSARAAIGNLPYLYTHIAVGTARTTTKLGSKAKMQAWGQVDSVYKSLNPTGIVGGVPPGNLWNMYKQHAATWDTTGMAPDNPWEWDEFINWFRRSQDTTGTMKKNYMPNGPIYPEKLFLWSEKQNNANCDTCTWGAWYPWPTNPRDSCYGMNSPNGGQRLNVLYRDTTTGELAIVEKMAQNQTYRHLMNTRYFSDTTKFQVDDWQEDFAGVTEPDVRFYTGDLDSVDLTRSGGAAFLGSTREEFTKRWVQASQEWGARAYYWVKYYRPTGGWASGNWPAKYADYNGDWAMADGYENDYTGDKGMGSTGGPIQNFYPARRMSSPTGGTWEPGLMTTYRTRRSDQEAVFHWHVNMGDSCNVSDERSTTLADRSRSVLGIAAMFNNVFPIMRKQGDNNVAQGLASSNASCYWYLNTLEWPYYWDEFLVDNKGNSKGNVGRGTTSYRGWLGTPLDREFTWGIDRSMVADSELISVMGADTTCNTSTGWTTGPSNFSMGALGGVDIYDYPGRGNVFRVRRTGIDHTSWWNVSLITSGSVQVSPYRRKSIRFWARGDSVTYFSVGLRRPQGGSTSGDMNHHEVWVDTTWREYEYQCGFKSTVPSHMDSTQVAFYFADTTGTIYLDNIRMYPRPTGFAYRKFQNGMVFFNPDSEAVKIYNIQTVAGDTAQYDYRHLNGFNEHTTLMNNGRVFGYSGAALDTIPAGTAKFIYRASNGAWNTASNVTRGGKKKKWWEWWINPSGEPTPIK